MSIFGIYQNVFSVFVVTELAAQVKSQPNVIITPAVSESPTIRKLPVSPLRNNFSVLGIFNYQFRLVVYMLLVFDDLRFVVCI